MRKLWSLVLITVLAVFQASCSFSDSYLIRNSSNGKLNVRYLIDPDTLMSNPKPRIAAGESWNSGEPSWSEPPGLKEGKSEKLIYFEFTLPSGYVAEIAHFPNGVSASESGRSLGIKSVGLTGVNGSVSRTGEQLVKAFELQSRGLRIIPSGRIYVLQYE